MTQLQMTIELCATTQTTEHSSPTNQPGDTSTRTNIPPTEYAQIRQTNSSPETIAALLNEKEEWYSKKLGLWSARRKYHYPFWKVCVVCQAVYPTTTQAQAKKKSCSQQCARKLMPGRTPGFAKPPEELDGMVQIECAVCGKVVWKHRAWLKGVASPTCSQQCNGTRRALALIPHYGKGRSCWTAESEQRLKERMTGSTNPAWKGGATYRHQKGNYGKQALKYVRCPMEFLPMARKDGYVTEHRLLVAMALGRCLNRQETVHHLNHNAEDNSIENLALFGSNRDHKLYERYGEPEPLWRG